MKSKITGAGVALATPFTASGSVDFDALQKLIKFVGDGGADFLVALGTTAEAPTLSEQEQADVLSCVRQSNCAGLPIVVGIGGNNTAAVIDKIGRTDLSGVDMILSSVPHYNKPSQQGIYEHFKAIAAASPVPVMLYNVPSRTGVNLSADTTLRLAHEVQNIAAIKEASGNIAQVGYILRSKPEYFTVLSGDDGLTLSLMAMGAEGVISVAMNALPAHMSRLVHLASIYRYREAAEIHLALLPFFDALFAEGSPAGIKAALAIQGICENSLRLPLVRVSEGLTEKMKVQLGALRERVKG